MSVSDGFGSGIFDNDIEEVIPEQAPVEPEPVMKEKTPSVEEEAPAPEVQKDEEDKPRRRTRSRDGEDRERRPRERRERSDRGERGGRGERGERSDRGDRGDRGGRGERGERGERPRRGRRDRDEERGRSGRDVEMVHSGAAVTSPCGVATGVGEAPAGTLVHQRIALLVDADLLDAQAGDRYNAKVSYRKVFSHAVRGRQAVRAIAYMSEEEEGARAPFQDHLGTSGFDMTRRVGLGVGHWDVQLALDALALAGKVDAVVVASSNPGLLPLLENLRAQGVKVEVASFLPIDECPLAGAAQAYIPLGNSALYVP